MPKRRGHGEGSISKRKDGRWVAIVTLRDGNRKSVYGKTRGEVATWLYRAVLALKDGQPLPQQVRAPTPWAPGKGCVSKRLDGRWMAYLSMPGGRRRCVYAKTEEGARLRLEELRASIIAALAEPGEAPPEPEIRLNKRNRFIIMQRDGFRCRLCGCDGSTTRLEIDHRIPKSRGGLNVMSNLWTLCFDCNSGKTNLEGLLPPI